MALLRSLWRERRERPMFVAVTLVVLAGLTVYPAVDWLLRGAGIAPQFDFWDFGAYRNATDRWLRGESIYVRNEEGGFFGTYLYPPLVLVAFLPFAGLAFDGAALAWTVCGTLLLWGGLQLVVSAVGYRLGTLERLGLLWLTVGFQPVLLTMKMGQLALVLTGGICLAFAANSTGDTAGRLTSGLLTAVVACVKLPYAPAGAHLLRGRRRLGGAIAGGAVFVGASVALFGLDPNWEFLNVLRWGIETGSDARSPRLWLPPYFRPFFGVPNPTGVRFLLAGVIAMAVAASGPGVDREAFALGVVAVPLLAPQTYTYYTVVCLPAVVLAVAAELDRNGRPTIPVFALGLLAVHSYGTLALVETIPPLPAWARPALLLAQPGVWGVWLLVGLTWVRVVQAVDPAVVPAPVARFVDRLARLVRRVR